MRWRMAIGPITGWSRALADATMAVVLSPACAACDTLLEQPTRGVVCGGCWTDVGHLSPPLCHACGDALPSWRAASRRMGRCPRCRRAPRAVDRARAIGPYEGSLRRIVQAFKYGGHPSLARPLASRMRMAGETILRSVDLAVPVPLHARRERARGFNQATALAGHLGLPVGHLLVRHRATRPQAELPAARRHANVRDAFRLSRHAHKLAVPRLRIVLVDDVMTTGATLDACARRLRTAGVRHISALTAARVTRAPT